MNFLMLLVLDYKKAKTQSEISCPCYSFRGHRIFLPRVIIDNTLQLSFEHKTTVNKKKEISLWLLS
jgi:hypothetical protein